MEIIKPIIRERVETYSDFARLLHHKIDKTFFGFQNGDHCDGIVSSDYVNHYNWCYDEVCNLFENEYIFFRSNKKLRLYFQVFYMKRFYDPKNMSENNVISDYLTSLFNTKQHAVNKSFAKAFQEIYFIFDETFDLKKSKEESKISI